MTGEDVLEEIDGLDEMGVGGELAKQRVARRQRVDRVAHWGCDDSHG